MVDPAQQSPTPERIPSPRWDEILKIRRGGVTHLSESIESFLRRTLEIEEGEDLEEALQRERDLLDQMEAPAEVFRPQYSSDHLAACIWTTIQTWGWKIEKGSEEAIFTRTLCDYFARDANFYESPLLIPSSHRSFDKGLFIIGNCGLGKTKTMGLMSKMIKETEEAFKPLQVQHVIKNWSELEMELTRKIYVDFQKGDERKFHLLLDDIGREEEKRTYEYGFNPIRTVIDAREILWANHRVKTHLISNYNSDQLTVFYGEALVDRMAGMSNIIKITGKSKR